MKKVLFFCLIIVALSSCTHYFVYDIEMTHPKTSGKLAYQCDTFTIDFQFKPKYIEFDIYNASQDGMKFNWDEVSMSLNGNTFRAIHSKTGIANVNELQPPTTIPPRSNLNDFILPREKMLFLRSVLTGEKITTSFDIFPVSNGGNKARDKYIKKLIGSRITVFMPFYMGGKYVSQYYDFEIKNIETKNKKPIAKK